MEIAIQTQVRVYLYEQVTTHNTGIRNEVITFAEVYPDKERAMRALKVGEVPNIEDGVVFEGRVRPQQRRPRLGNQTRDQSKRRGWMDDQIRGQPSN